MSIETKRGMISWAYPGDKWLENVKNMSEKQVHTVYMRIQNASPNLLGPRHWGLRKQ